MSAFQVLPIRYAPSIHPDKRVPLEKNNYLWEIIVLQPNLWQVISREKRTNKSWQNLLLCTVIQSGDKIVNKISLIRSSFVFVEIDTDLSENLTSPPEILVAQTAQRASSVGTSYKIIFTKGWKVSLNLHFASILKKLSLEISLFCCHKLETIVTQVKESKSMSTICSYVFSVIVNLH